MSAFVKNVANLIWKKWIDNMEFLIEFLVSYAILALIFDAIKLIRAGNKHFAKAF